MRAALLAHTQIVPHTKRATHKACHSAQHHVAQVPGTMLTTFVIGYATFSAGTAGWFRDGDSDALDFRTPLDSFVFGALISATDPVATLSIMSSTNADPVLYTLVFGESVLNDAVAIVMVRILQKLGNDGFKHPSHFLSGVGAFALVGFGSVVVGALVSALSALLLKHVNMHHHAAYELSLICLFGYCSYCAAEAIGCSGIVALFITGALEAHYHAASLSKEAREAAPLALKSLAHLSENAVFAYMGVNLWSEAGASEAERGHQTRFVLFCLGAVLLARLLVVLPLCGVANCFRTSPISKHMCGAIVYAGLRGAIAFALAINCASLHKANITLATTVVVLFTTFVLGGSTRPLLLALGLSSGGEQPDPVRELKDIHSTPSRTDAEVLIHRRASFTTHIKNRWDVLDSKVLKPMFVRGGEEPGSGSSVDPLGATIDDAATIISMHPTRESTPTRKSPTRTSTPTLEARTEHRQQPRQETEMAQVATR